MFSGNGRSYWLIILALGNLVLWVAIATLVGLLVSDQVNLGLETELRQVQATVIAAWRGLSDRDLALPGRSTPLVSSPRPTPRPLATREVDHSSGGARPDLAWSTAEEPGTQEGGTKGTVPEPTSADATAAAVPPPATSISQAAGGSQPGPTVSPEPTPNKAAGEQSAVAGEQGTAQDTTRPYLTPTPVLLIRPLLLADPAFQDLAMLNAEMQRSAPGRVVQIRYQEEVLSAEINKLCENNPDLPFSNVQTDLLRDQVILTGEVTVLGFQVEVQVRATVAARDCQPEIEIQSIGVGGLLTPQYVRDRIDQQVLEAMTWYPADYPLCLEQILLEDTRATIWGYRR